MVRWIADEKPAIAARRRNRYLRTVQDSSVLALYDENSPISSIMFLMQYVLYTDSGVLGVGGSMMDDRVRQI